MERIGRQDKQDAFHSAIARDRGLSARAFAAGSRYQGMKSPPAPALLRAERPQIQLTG